MVRENIEIVSVFTTVCLVLVLFKIVNFSIWYNGDNRNFATVTQKNEEEQKGKEITKFSSKLLSFSKEKRNIVIIVLDMANGGLIQHILKNAPQLEGKYRGFTWYPNTLSITNNTYGSKPSILGECQFSPENIANVKGNNLVEKFTVVHDTIIDTFQSYEYQIDILGIAIYGKERNERCIGLCKKGLSCILRSDLSESYQIPWLERHPQQKILYDSFVSNEHKLDSITVKEKILLFLLASLLCAVSITLRKIIYNDEKWHGLLEYEYHKLYLTILRDWAFIDSLSYVSRVRDEATVQENERNGTFIFFHNEITHGQYGLDTKYKVFYNTDFKDNNGLGNDAHYYSLKCTLKALGKWFDWLRKNDIYNNTKIIIVSDHSTNIEYSMNVKNIVVPSNTEDNLFPDLHALLMVKDFGDTETFSIDNRFMSNADTASIAFHGTENFQRPDTIIPDPTLSNNIERDIASYVIKKYEWEDLIKIKDTYPIEEKYIVSDNMFEIENWKKIK